MISQFDVNCQLAMGGLGTATSEVVELLGLEPHKAVILSIAREDMVDAIYKEMGMAKKTKGIAFSLPVSDVAGLAPKTMPWESVEE